MQPYRRPLFPEVAELLLATLNSEAGRGDRLDILVGALSASYYVGRQASAEAGDDAGEILMLPVGHQTYIYDAMTTDIPKHKDHYTGCFHAILTGLVESPTIRLVPLRHVLMAIHAPCH